jgi:hypothetical protein
MPTKTNIIQDLISPIVEEHFPLFTTKNNKYTAGFYRINGTKHPYVTVNGHITHHGFQTTKGVDRFMFGPNRIPKYVISNLKHLFTVRRMFD